MTNTEMMDDRLRFLEIDQDVIDDLRTAKRLLEPELDNMLEKFYARILDEPLLKSVFSDEESIGRARDAQKNHWLRTLLGGSLSSSYFDKAERIGRAHARVGLTPDWYIGGYCKMLVQFIQHISAVAEEEGRDATPVIQSLCKAVLLDLDLVIHCYLEAKDEQMLEILARATTFTSDMKQLNAELASETAQVSESFEAVSADSSADGKRSYQLETLKAHIDALTEKVKQIDERTRQLKTKDRLYVHKDSEETGTFAKLKSLILGD